ncbi:PREDICTED: uncharacterized protein LOC109234663 [Nicotiana attenuata]|uniref:uncharacterized protein LOC109234663 n=1 Tax=Nicotiana attenuata TaxID=49451 RepID=UPI0009051C3C|nr:PREDICTED: uncharacterized protein LOC109234663 [Nicotiana attenuata]
MFLEDRFHFRPWRTSDFSRLLHDASGHWEIFGSSNFGATASRVGLNLFQPYFGFIGLSFLASFFQLQFQIIWVPWIFKPLLRRSFPISKHQPPWLVEVDLIPPTRTELDQKGFQSKKNGMGNEFKTRSVPFEESKEGLIWSNRLFITSEVSSSRKIILSASIKSSIALLRV